MANEKLREDHKKLEKARPKKALIPRYDPKQYVRKELLLRFKSLVKKRQDGKGLESLSMQKTMWVMGLTWASVKKAIKKGDIIAHVIGGSDGIPYQIDAESVWKVLNNPPKWVIESWKLSGKNLNTRTLSNEDWAKRAYRIFKESGKLPYPNANQTAANRSRYYSTDEMAEKLGISSVKYQQIKPIVDILFETEKSLKNELVIQAVQAQFDKKVAHRANKRLENPEDPWGRVIDAEYQVSGA